MHRFEFSLQRVLDVKETEEKALQRNLAKAQSEHRLSEELQAEFELRLERELQSFQAIGSQTTSSGEIQLHQHYIESLRSMIAEQAKLVAALHAKMEQARTILLNKTKEKKSLEQLKQNQLESYKKERAHVEQSILDEATAQNAKYHAVGGKA